VSRGGSTLRHRAYAFTSRRVAPSEDDLRQRGYAFCFRRVAPSEDDLRQRGYAFTSWRVASSEDDVLPAAVSSRHAHALLLPQLLR
jgi:hypothetical protein